MAAATENGTAAPPESVQKEPSKEGAQREAAQREAVQKEAVQKELAKLEVLHVYQHSNFFYWWVVWAYGFFCAILTYFNGHTVPFFADRQLYVHSSAWVGISFVALLLIVTFFTNYRVKGANSFIMVLGIALVALAMHLLGAWEVIFNLFPALLIFMNLAFYVTLSTALLLLWLFATFVLDRLTYWEFTPGQVTLRHRLAESSESFDAHGLHLDRISDDILINKILGLRFLGYGTADLRFTTSGAVRNTFTIENVWNANLRDAQIRELIVVRPNVAA
jgi:hypothetical protein